MVSSGIYAIVNSINGEQYIGSSVNIKRRLKRHLYDLHKGRHNNKYLQRAYNKNPYAFKTNILCYYAPQLLTFMEQRFVDIINPEYNMCKKIVTSCLGIKRSDKTKKRMSRAATGRRHTKETKEKLSILSIGNNSALGYRYSDEAKKQMSERMLGKVLRLGKQHTEETKLKISKAKTGIKLSGAHKAKIRASSGGWKHTPETRAKISASKIGKSRLGIKGRAVKNIENNEMYISVPEAAKAIHINSHTLYAMLSGTNTNKSGMVFV